LWPEEEVDSQVLARAYHEASTALWDGWRRFLDGEGVPDSELCFDGPAVAETYFQEVPRILVVLREPNDCRQHELIALLRTEAKWRAWRNVARWAAGIQRAFPPFAEVQHQATQNDALRRIAAINIKKASGGASSDLVEIRRYAMSAVDLHRKQISLLRPDVVIAAGTLGDLRLIVELDSGEAGLLTGRLPNGHRFRVISWHHPSARGSTRESYDGFRVAYRGNP